MIPGTPYFKCCVRQASDGITDRQIHITRSGKLRIATISIKNELTTSNLRIIVEVSVRSANRVTGDRVAFDRKTVAVTYTRLADRRGRQPQGDNRYTDYSPRNSKLPHVTPSILVEKHK